MYSGSESNKRCPRCNAPLADGATTCPNCGQAISSLNPASFASQGTPGDPYNPGDPYSQPHSSYGQSPSPYEQPAAYRQPPSPYGQSPSPYGQPTSYGHSGTYNAQTPQLPFQPMSSQPPFAAMPAPQKKPSSWMIGALVVCVIVLVGGGALVISAFNTNQAQIHTNATATAQTLHATATTQAIATATATAIVDPHIPAGANATLTLNDPLTQPGNWPSVAQCQFQADGYHVSTATANKFHGCETAGTYTNTSLQVGVKLLRGPCVGLITRDNGQTSFNGYIALVCNDNSYTIQVLTNGAGTILDQGTTTVFHSSSNQENILTLVASGQTITFYVNGTQLSSVTNSQYQGQGQLGLVSYSGNAPASEAVFDHAKVWTF